MHPFLSRPERLLSYLAGWLGFALLASLAVSFPDGSFFTSLSITAPVALSYSFVSLSSWYLCRSLPLRDTHPIRLVVSVVASSVVGGMAFFGLAIGWGWIVYGTAPPLPIGPLLIFTAGVVLYLLGIVLHYLLIAFEASRNAERRSLEAEIHARSSELKALRAQIDPHFLFNALNSIASLITTDASRARTMTVQLADFFRSSVAAGRQHLIPLSEELMLVGTYLDIEGVRYGKRLGVSVTKGTGTDTVRVPPLILQPLVENAIKHGIANLLDGGTIEIESRLAADMLSILIRNPVDPGPPTGQTKGTGFGVQAVRDRLKAIAPEKGFLDVRQSEDYYEAVIGLPTDLR